MGILVKLLISSVAVALVVVHQLCPAVKVDATTLLLLGVVALPWLIAYVKGFEIPGVIKIDLKDAKAATDKIMRAQPKSGELVVSGHAPAVKVTLSKDSFWNLKSVFETDPNLALVGFRIEIERRVRQIAEANGVPLERATLGSLIYALVAKQVVASEMASGLLELVALGNQAAHGIKVSVDAASWVLDVGPSILLQLDALLTGKQDG